MPRVIRPISSESVSITERVIKHITRDLLKQSGFKEDVEVLMDGITRAGFKQTHNHAEQHGSNAVKTAFSNYAMIEYTERFIEDAVTVSRWQQQRTPNIFDDYGIGTHVQSIYTTAVLELTIKLRSSSFTALQSYLNGLRLVHSKQNLNFRHHVDYDYRLPDDFIAFIGDGYEMQRYGHKPSLRDYMASHFRKGVQTRKSLNGANTEIITVEQQSGVVGIVKEEFFYNEKEISDGLFEVSIPYTVEYYKPIALRLDFPAFIQSQTIPHKYVDTWLKPVKRDLGKDHPLWMATNFRTDNASNFFIGDGGSRMVEWDDWFPSVYEKDTQTVTIVPVTADPKSPTSVFNLKEIPERYLPSAIITYMQDFYALQGLYRESIVVVELYAVGNGEERIPLSIDADLNITTVSDMDLKKQHYLRISLMVDLASYSVESTKDLLEVPETAIELFKLYDPTVYLTDDTKHVKDVLPEVIRPGFYSDIPSVLLATGDNAITAHTYTTWLHKLKDSNTAFLNLRPRNHKGVGQYNLVARRRTCPSMNQPKTNRPPRPRLPHRRRHP